MLENKNRFDVTFGTTIFEIKSIEVENRNLTPKDGIFFYFNCHAEELIILCHIMNIIYVCWGIYNPH